MKKLIAIALLMLTVTACSKKERVLHVLQAPKSMVVGDDKRGYKLVLDEMHDTVIWFSDRPDRKAGKVYIHDFLKAWDQGKDSFKADPPNAVLIIDRGRPVVIEMTLENYNDERAIFKIKPLDSKEFTLSDKSGAATLYIDANTVNPMITD